MFLLNQTRVTGEQRFDKERLVSHYHEINPGAGNIHARQIALVVHQLVHLRDDDAVVEGSGFDQRRGILGTGTGIKVPFTVRFKTGNQRHVWRQINIQAGVELDVGVDGTNLQLPVFQQLRNTQALSTGEREVEFAGNALLKNIQVLATTNARHNHMQVVNDLRVHFGEHS